MHDCGTTSTMEIHPHLWAPGPLSGLGIPPGSFSRAGTPIWVGAWLALPCCLSQPLWQGRGMGIHPAQQMAAQGEREGWLGSYPDCCPNPGEGPQWHRPKVGYGFPSCFTWICMKHEVPKSCDYLRNHTTDPPRHPSHFPPLICVERNCIKSIGMSLDTCDNGGTTTPGLLLKTTEF